MSVGRIDLRELLTRLATRSPGRTESIVQSDVRILLLAAPSLSLEEQQVVLLESPVGDRKRIDVETGQTVFEVKRDLTSGSVRAEAEEQLAGYVRQRSVELDRRYVGVLTDGQEWRLYYLTPANDLVEVASHSVNPRDPDVEALLVWLESVLATASAVVPTPTEIRQRLGADSPNHKLDIAELLALYNLYAAQPEVQIKRELWARLLTTAFGATFSDDAELFVEHSLLVATAEIIAHAVVGFDPANPDLDPRRVMSGALFEQAQIRGVVEEDFFDWIAAVPGGEAFVRGLARRLSRFAWIDVQHDVLKELYESVISAEQRHGLGEYYTPDWLADQVVREAAPDPLNTRILDPACGSGSFLFVAVRQYLEAAEAAGISNVDAIDGVTRYVVGIDVHPVAVTFARVTFLLAIGVGRIAGERGAINVPVYLGDSLQWRQQTTLFDAGQLSVSTEGEDDLRLISPDLRFPERLLDDVARFDQLVAELASKASNRPRRGPRPSRATIDATLRRYAVHPDDEPMIRDTFDVMCSLHDDAKNHIWGYYVRNLARPTWLSLPQNRVDVVVGNPPWLAYRFMTEAMQEQFRSLSRERSLWAGGPAAPHQDLSGLFFVRAVELYLKEGGRIAFVMPHAVLSRRQHAGFRTGSYVNPRSEVTVDFATVWDLQDISPIPFPVPSCVVFATRSDHHATPVPSTVERWAGSVPGRNATWSEAGPSITRGSGETAVATRIYASPYGVRFSAGATIFPRVLLIVEDAPASSLGVGSGRRAVRSHRSRQEESPWRELPSRTGVIEAEFIRPIHFGTTTAPYRLLAAQQAIIPRTSTEALLTDEDAWLDDYPGLASWWHEAAALWAANRQPRSPESLAARIAFHGDLTRQFPIAPQRVVYSASGSRLAAARLTDVSAIVEHKLYWTAAASEREALYLVAVLNSNLATERASVYQSRGAFGRRDFDKTVFYAPIPFFDPSIELHARLSDLGGLAEQAAASVDLPENSYFVSARRRIRDHLADTGIAAQIEDAVAALIPAPTDA